MSPEQSHRPEENNCDAELRQQALERLRQGHRPVEEMGPHDIEKLVHELEVHQVELEMQNETLRLAQLELIKARDRYAELYEHAPVGYLALDRHGTIQRVNLAAQRLCGLDRELLIGLRVESLFQRQDRDACYLLIQEASNGRSATRELRLERFDQKVIWLIAEVAPEVDSPQGPDAIRLTFSDVSALKQTELSLKKRTEQLSEEVKERTALAKRLRTLVAEQAKAEQREARRISEVLHENVQQILVGCQYRLSTLLHLNTCPEAAESIRTMRSQLEEATQISRSLAAELVPTELAEVGLAAALRSLAEHVTSAYGLAVSTEVVEEADVAEYEVRAFLYQTVRELLLNVLKHASAESARIMGTRTRHGVRIAVEDNGVGCDLPRTPPSTDGSGLSSIRLRLETLGGHFQFESAPRRGCRVAVTVPAEAQLPATNWS